MERKYSQAVIEEAKSIIEKLRYYYGEEYNQIPLVLLQPQGNFPSRSVEGEQGIYERDFEHELTRSFVGYFLYFKNYLTPYYLYENEYILPDNTNTFYEKHAERIATMNNFGIFSNGIILEGEYAPKQRKIEEIYFFLPDIEKLSSEVLVNSIVIDNGWILEVLEDQGKALVKNRGNTEYTFRSLGTNKFIYFRFLCEHKKASYKELYEYLNKKPYDQMKEKHWIVNARIRTSINDLRKNLVSALPKIKIITNRGVRLVVEK